MSLFTPCASRVLLEDVVHQEKLADQAALYVPHQNALSFYTLH